MCVFIFPSFFLKELQLLYHIARFCWFLFENTSYTIHPTTLRACQTQSPAVCTLQLKLTVWQEFVQLHWKWFRLMLTTKPGHRSHLYAFIRRPRLCCHYSEQTERGWWVASLFGFFLWGTPCRFEFSQPNLLSMYLLISAQRGRECLSQQRVFKGRSLNCVCEAEKSLKGIL